MQLLSSLSRDYIISTTKQNVIANYRNRERCIASLFWSLYDQLAKGKSTILVVDNKEDIEYLNYLLYKFGIKDLSLIIDHPEDINASQIQARLNEGEKLKDSIGFSVAELKNVEAQLTELINDTRKKTERLRIPQLGSLSIVNINDSLELRDDSKVDVETAILKPPYTYEAYSDKKKLFESIEKIYNVNYHFVKRQDPLTPSILNEVSEQDLNSVLKDFKLRAYELLEGFNLIYQEVLNYFRNDIVDKSDEIKQKLAEVSDMMSRTDAITDTEIVKLLHLQKSLYRTLEIPTNSPGTASELIGGLEEIRNAVNAKSQSDYTNSQKETQSFLEQLTSSNPEFPQLEDLINQVNKLTEDIRSAEVFKEMNLKRSVTFGYQKANLQEIIDQLEYAHFFIDNNPEYLEWKTIEKTLSSEDMAIVDHLAKQSNFWGKAFEKLFLQYYLNHSGAALDSAQNNHKNFDHLIKQYLKLYPSSIIQKCLKVDCMNSPKLPKQWQDYLGENARVFQERFPLLIVTSAFYKQHYSRLVPSSDLFMFFDTAPKTIVQETWLRNYFVGYSSDFKLLSSTLQAKLESCDLIPDEHLNYTINRSLSNYNLAEVNTAARYLGQELHKVSSEYRIFQLRNVSVISFWAPLKNVKLLEALDTYGVKEIIGTEDQRNLLPGILANKEETTFILLEDNLFTYSKSSNILDQHLLLEEIVTAGIKVLTVDNYKMINAGTQTLARSIRRITQELALPKTHAMA